MPTLKGGGEAVEPVNRPPPGAVLQLPDLRFARRDARRHFGPRKVLSLTNRADSGANLYVVHARNLPGTGHMARVTKRGTFFLH